MRSLVTEWKTWRSGRIGSLLIALEQGEMPAQFYDGCEFAVFLEREPDRVGHGRIYGEHVVMMNGPTLE